LLVIITDYACNKQEKETVRNDSRQRKVSEYLPVLRLLVTHRALELRLHAALESNVPIEAVRSRISISAA
jgi:hypothetical protein